MHTFNAHHDGTTIHYNSDLSGDVLILPRGEREPTSVSGRDLLEFLAEQVRMLQMTQLEDAPISHLLGLSGGGLAHLGLD